MSLMRICGSVFHVFALLLTIDKFGNAYAFVSKASNHPITRLNMDGHGQWYNDPDLERDRSHVIENGIKYATSKNARYVLLEENNGMYYSAFKDSSSVEPLYLTYDEIKSLFGNKIVPSMLNEPGTRTDKSLLAWIGKKQEEEFWVLYLADKDKDDLEGGQELQSQIAGTLARSEGSTILASNLREFGDLLESSNDAGVLATANGLVEFHKSHPFCNKCGSPTISAKVGACRRCTNCRASAYPRIDVASIMIITSPCEEFALLGRKSSWPKGRYSALAGFTEIGETIESSCVRETMEESGVAVDPASVRFVCSQPWPLPRSLMVGFQAKALPNDKDEHLLPVIDISIDELEDVQWFHKDYVSVRLDEGYYSTLSFDPKDGDAAEFHVPGRASLARLLISNWATGK